MDENSHARHHGLHGYAAAGLSAERFLIGSYNVMLFVGIARLQNHRQKKTKEILITYLVLYRLGRESEMREYFLIPQKSPLKNPCGVVVGTVVLGIASGRKCLAVETSW